MPNGNIRSKGCVRKHPIRDFQTKMCRIHSVHRQTERTADARAISRFLLVSGGSIVVSSLLRIPGAFLIVGWSVVIRRQQIFSGRTGRLTAEIQVERIIRVTGVIGRGGRQGAIALDVYINLPNDLCTVMPLKPQFGQFIVHGTGFGEDVAAAGDLQFAALLWFPDILGRADNIVLGWNVTAVVIDKGI